MEYKQPDVDLPYGNVDDIVVEALKDMEEPKRKRKAEIGQTTGNEPDTSKNTSFEDSTFEEVTTKPRTRSTRASSGSRKDAKSSEKTSQPLDKSVDEPPKSRRKRGRPKRINTSDESVFITGEKKAKMKQHDFTTSTWLKGRHKLILDEKERPSPDVTNVMNPIQHDYSHWREIENDLTSCIKDFEKMRTCADCHMTGLQGSAKIETLFNYRLTWDKQDSLAHSLFPRDGPYDRSLAFEVTTGAVGDCFLDALSRLTFGNQNHSRELRTRMTLEGIAYEEWYLSHDNLAIKLPLLTTTHSLPERYALYSGTKAKDYRDVYREEIKRCFKNGEYCGLWQIHQMASVIGRPITSVFPEFDDVEDEAPLRYYHNRIIYPRREEDRSKETVVIMWTKASPFADDLANHIVPVVK